MVQLIFAILFQALVPEKYDVIVTIILNYIYTFINDYKYQVIFITVNAISSASALFDTSTAIELRILLIIFGCVLGYIINKINFRKYFTLLKRKFRKMGKLGTHNLSYENG